MRNKSKRMQTAHKNNFGARKTFKLDLPTNTAYIECYIPANKPLMEENLNHRGRIETANERKAMYRHWLTEKFEETKQKTQQNTDSIHQSVIAFKRTIENVGGLCFISYDIKEASR